MLESSIRPLKRTLICGYKSVSNFAQDVISGVPPIDLLTELKLRVARKENRSEVELNIRKKWKIKWDNELGNKWIKTVITDLDAWLDRSHGCPDFYITQFLSGHGSFGNYLEKRKLINSPFCACGEIDTPEHAFFDCVLIKDKLTKLENDLTNNVSKNNLLDLMLISKGNWHKGYVYIKDILDTKIKYYKELTNPTLPDVMSPDGPGVPSPGPS